MARLFGELRRRNVLRVAAGYVVVGWLIVQVVSALSTPLVLPFWFTTVVVVLPGIGFPLVLLFARTFLKEHVTKTNLVGYWCAYACRPVGDDDFTCR